MLEGKKYKTFSTHSHAEGWLYRRKNELLKKKFETLSWSIGIQPNLGHLRIRWQICLQKRTSVKSRYAKQIAGLWHATIGDCCTKKLAYCVRAYPNTTRVRVYLHQVGKCPLCYYEETK